MSQNKVKGIYVRIRDAENKKDVEDFINKLTAAFPDVPRGTWHVEAYLRGAKEMVKDLNTKKKPVLTDVLKK